MALLKDSLVQGSLRVTDELYSDVAYLKTIYAGTSSSDSTPSNGDNGQVLKSNGNSVYWAADIDTDTHYTTHLRTASSATATTQVTTETTSPYLNLLDNSTVRDSVRFVGSGTTTVKSSADGKTITINSADSKTGTVTSVQVAATSPIESSISTASSTTLSTTISLANEYGDKKNPYGSKTKSYVLAAPSSANGVPDFRALVAADIPNLAWSKITSGNDDLKAIENLTGTSGFLKKTAANTWTLDTGTYLPLADALWNTQGTLIPDNTDLNSYNQTDNGLGNYYSPDSSTSGSLDNSPTANSGFRLISLRGYQNTRGYQIALGTSVTPWVRTETGTARNYTDWAKILYKTGSSAIGGNSQPVYIDSNGKAVAVTSVNVAHGGTGATTAADARTNLLAATGNGRIFYGTCTTAGGTAAKVVTCESYDTLTVGDIIVVDFSNTNSAAVTSLTLNVNGKGAKNIKKHYNSTAANNLNAVGVLTNSIHTFVYDGSYWILIDSDYNSSYSVMSVNEMQTGTATSSRVMTAKNLNDFLESYELNANNITSGTLAVARGGTGKSSWTANQIVYASAATTLAQLSHASSTSYLLKSGSSSTAPSWIQYTNSNTASTIVQRDSSGNFSADTITATLNGTATNATNANIGNMADNTNYYLNMAVGTGNQGLKKSNIVYNGGTLTGYAMNDTTYTTTAKWQLNNNGSIVLTNQISGGTSAMSGTPSWYITSAGAAYLASLNDGIQIAARNSSGQGGALAFAAPSSSVGKVAMDYIIASSTPYIRFLYYNSSDVLKHEVTINLTNGTVTHTSH